MAEGGARPRIWQAALEIMARKGVAGTTTQDIARRARCSQAAIYKFWEGKDALAHELCEAANEAMLDAMEAGIGGSADARDRVLGVLKGLLAFARARPAEFAFLFQVFHSDYARWLVPHPKPRDIVVRELRAAAAAGRIEARDPSVKAAILLGMTIRLAFFERQGLLEGGAAADEGLWRAAAAVLED